MRKGQIISDGFKLNYIIEGKGPPAIVVGSSLYYSRVFSNNLRNYLELIFVDHRGFASTDKDFTNDDFTLEKISLDLEKIRKCLGLSKIIIIGHSGHGYMALHYANSFPQHVSNIIIIAMSPDASLESFKAADLYLEESVCPKRKIALEKSLSILEKEIKEKPNDRFILYSLRNGPRIWFNYKFNSSYLWDGVTVIPKMFDYMWGRVFKNIDITKNSKIFSIPILLMLGRYDYWNPYYLWEKNRSMFKNLTIRVFEKSGHTPQFEEPELFDCELLMWLKNTKIL